MSATSYAKVTLGLGVALFIAAILFESAGSPVHAASFDVCASGCQFKTIQAAVNGTVAGGTITVASGVYNETVTVNKAVTIKGPQAGANADRQGIDANEAIVIGTPDSDGNRRSFIIATSEVTIDGLMLGPTTANSAFTGVYLTNGSAHTTIVSTVIRNGNYGIDAHWTDGLSIENDQFDTNFIGIYAAHVSNLKIGVVSPVLFNSGSSDFGIILEWGTHVQLGVLTLSGTGNEVTFNADDNVTFNGVTQAHMTDGTFTAVKPAAVTTMPATSTPAAESSTTPSGAPLDGVNTTVSSAASAAPLSSRTETLTAAVLPQTGIKREGVMYQVGSLIVVGLTVTILGVRVILKNKPHNY